MPMPAAKIIMGVLVVHVMRVILETVLHVQMLMNARPVTQTTVMQMHCVLILLDRSVVPALPDMKATE